MCIVTKKALAAAERRLLSYMNASEYLGISVRAMKDLAADGAIRKVQIGHRVLFDREDLDAYIERIKRTAS